MFNDMFRQISSRISSPARGRRAGSPVGAAALVLLVTALGLSTAFPDPHPASARDYREHSPGPGEAVLYVFYFAGNGCDSCAQIKPLIKAAEVRYRGLVVTEEVNVDQPKNHRFAQSVELSGIPAVYVVGRNGQSYSRLEGYGQASEVLADVAMALPRAVSAADSVASDKLAPLFTERIRQLKNDLLSGPLPALHVSLKR